MMYHPACMLRNLHLIDSSNSTRCPNPLPIYIWKENWTRIHDSGGCLENIWADFASQSETEYWYKWSGCTCYVALQSERRNFDEIWEGVLVISLCNQRDRILIRIGRVYLLFHFTIRDRMLIRSGRVYLLFHFTIRDRMLIRIGRVYLLFHFLIRVTEFWWELGGCTCYFTLQSERFIRTINELLAVINSG